MLFLPDFIQTPPLHLGRHTDILNEPGRFLLGETVVHHRIELLAEIIRLLLKMIPDQRGYSVRESAEHYQINTPLIENIPF